MEHNLQDFAVGYTINTMEQRRIPQKEIAVKLGLSKQTVSNYLTNKSKFTLPVLEEFLAVLGLPVSAMVDEYERQFMGGDNGSPHNIQTGDNNKAINYNAQNQSKINVGNSGETLKIKLEAANDKIKLLEQQIELYKKIIK